MDLSSSKEQLSIGTRGVRHSTGLPRKAEKLMQSAEHRLPGSAALTRGSHAGCWRQDGGWMGRITAPQSVHTLIPGACEYVTLYGIRVLAEAIKDLDTGDYSGRRGGLMLPALKMEPRCHEPGNVVASKSWDRQGNGFSPRHSWISNYRITSLYCFKPPSSWYLVIVAIAENTYGQQRQVWFSPSPSIWF